jgi:hypothetical protein
MPGDAVAGDTIFTVDERVLTEHSGTPDTEDTDSFPAVTGGTSGEAPGDAATEQAGETAPAGAPGAAAPQAPATPAPTAPAAPAAPVVPAARSSRLAQVPYAIALAGVTAGLVWAWQGSAHVRAGMVTVAAVLLAAAVGRLVLPERRAGMLATRHRLLDVATMMGLGVCLLVMAIVLPRAT